MNKKHAGGVRLLTSLTAIALLCAGLAFSVPAVLRAASEAMQWHVSSAGNDVLGCGTTADQSCKTVSFVLASPNFMDGSQINIAGEIADNFTVTKPVMLAGSSGAVINGTGARILTVNAGVNVALSNLTLLNGGGTQDGGLVHNAGTLVINNVVLTQSVVTGAFGGAIFNTGTLTITNSIISNSRAQYGGGIENQGTLFVSSSTIANNLADYGGGVDNSFKGVAHLYRTNILNNTAPAAGGGIYNDISLTARVWLTDTAVVSNTTLNEGGGIFNGGQLSIFNSTVGHNHSSLGLGAAIHLHAGSSTLSMQYATIADNTVANTANASAVNLEAPGTIKNSVLDNAGLNNCSGTPASNGYNLSSDATCGFNQPTDLNSTDAMLGSLLPSSGAFSTLVLAPLPASPLVNRIPPASCGATSDQRGVARPQDGACDIGAVEAVPVDLSLVAQSSPPSLPAGAPLTVQLSVVNAGPVLATGVVVTSDLPAGTTLLNCDGVCVSSGSRLTVTLGTINAGALATSTVRLASQSGGVQSIAFNAMGNEWDKQMSNNAAIVTATVQASADVSVVLAAPASVSFGAVFTLTALVENKSNFAAGSMIFTMTLPAAATYIDDYGEGWTCGQSAGVLSCTYASSLGAKSSASPVFILMQSGDAPAALQFVGGASSNMFDPNPGNNIFDMITLVGAGSKVFVPIVVR